MDVDYSKCDGFIKWTSEKIRLDNNASRSMHRHVTRGQVYRCNFGCGIGSEMKKDRPAVIISNFAMNIHSGNVIVVPITHDSSTLPCMVPIRAQTDMTGNIILDGFVNTSNIMCVSKARLGDFVSALPQVEIKKIDAAIARTISIMSYYNEVSNELVEKTTRLNIVKSERNEAKDELKELYSLLGVDSFDAAKKKLSK